MANNKRKDLNIGSFIEDVKADQTTTERKPAAPVAETPAPAPAVSRAFSSSPAEPYPAPAAPAPTPVVAPYPSVGRPAKKQSLLSKKLAKLVYIDEDTELQLKLIKTFQNYDYKEVIFTAIHEFMERHYSDMRLDESGVKKVDKIIREYKTRS